MIKKISNLQDPQLDVYARFSEVQLLRLYEPKEGIFIAESPKVIERALDAGYEPISFLLEEKGDGSHQKEEGEHQLQEGMWDWHTALLLERCGDIPVYTAPSEVLKQLTGFPLTRGMLCAMRRKRLPDFKDICQNATRIAVLENVVNPTNVGAIFRSAAALNMDAVILSDGCSNPLYRRAARVSMGTVFQIPWTFFQDKEADARCGIEQLKELGFYTVAMALKEDSLDIDDASLSDVKRLAIVLGTEGEGLTDDSIETCDATVRIPMSHGVDSLNVAAASAVAFWQLGNRNGK